VPITSTCHNAYASSSHSGFRSADANAAGRELPGELEPGCDVEPKLEPEGEPDTADPPASVPPPPPPAADTPLDAEWPPLPGHEDEPEEPAEPEEEDEEEEKDKGGPRLETGGAGTASESTYTSPRMCSTNWAGTPDWFTGCVKTTCKPVAVTVSSVAFGMPLWSPKPGSVPAPDWSLEVVVVPLPVPG